MNFKSHRFIPITNKKNANSVLICGECWNIVRIKNIPQIEFDIESTYNGFMVNHVKPDFEIYCENCDNFMFQCDEEFVSRIIALNKLGVTTRFCCEGHMSEARSIKNNHKYLIIDMPYLAIDKSINPVVLGIMKNILGEQRYQFIKFEDDMDDMYVIRGSLYDQSSIIEELTEEDDKSEMRTNFEVMKSRYFDFIDDFIYDIELYTIGKE